MINLNQQAPVTNNNKLPINLVFYRKDKEVIEQVDVTTKRQDDTDRKHNSTLKKDTLKPQFKPSFNCLETLSKLSSDVDKEDPDRELTNQSVSLQTEEPVMFKDT